MAAPPLAAVLSGEAGPDGVRTALRSPALRGAVRRAAADLLAPGAALGRIRLDRVKLKPGRKLSAWGRAAVLDPGGRRIEVPLAVTWVPPSAVAREIRTTPEQLVDPWGALRAWRAADEATGMELLASPFDPDAPELPLLLAPGAVPDRPVATTVRYRPRQRHVVRYDTEDPGADPRWAKLAPGRDGAAAAATATALAIALAGRGPVAAVRPLGLVAGSAVLYPSAPGRPLPALLRPGRPWPLKLLYRCGAALRQVHDLPVGTVPGGPVVPVEQELAALTRAGEHLAVLDPPAARALGDVVEVAGALLASGELTPVHGDTKLDHFWLTPATVTFIDLDRAAVADPARDLGKLLADLRWWTGRSGLQDLDGARAAVAAGYDAPEREARAAAWEAVLLAKAVVRRTSLLDAEWAARTRVGLTQAAALLDASPAGPLPVAASG